MKTLIIQRDVVIMWLIIMESLAEVEAVAVLLDKTDMKDMWVYFCLLVYSAKVDIIIAYITALYGSCWTCPNFAASLMVEGGGINANSLTGYKKD